MKEVNFLPPSYRRQRAKRRSARRLMVVGLVALAGVLVWTGIELRQNAVLRRAAEALELQVHSVRDQLNEVVSLRREREVLRHQVRVQQELALPLHPTELLGILAERLPETVGTLRLRYQTVRPKPQTIEEAQREERERGERNPKPARAAGEWRIELELVAFAPDDLVVTNVVEALSRDPLFSRVSMRYSRAAEVQGVMGREFQIELETDLNRRFVRRRLAEGAADVD